VVLEAGRNFEILEVSPLELEFGNLVDVLGSETLLALRNERTLSRKERTTPPSSITLRAAY